MWRPDRARALGTPRASFWPMVSGTKTALSSGLAGELIGAFQDHILWFGALLLLVRLLG